MRIVVTGTNGQVGWELVRSLAPLGEVVPLDRRSLDLAAPESIAGTVGRLRPDVIVNAAAYTAVDRAEAEPALADRINGESVGRIADEAARCGALFVHYSTDYVFDGQKGAPYVESDPVAPLNAYGRSKWLGEQAVRASDADWLIFRTTWVYGQRGNNFLQTILRLARERETLRIVSDQHGAPTTARFLADATARIVQSAQVERGLGNFSSGLYHLTAAGRTTWHGFAEAIVRAFGERSDAGALAVRHIEGIPTAAYPTPARRPTNSLLDNDRLVARFGIHRPDWHDGMSATLQDLVRFSG